MNEMKRRLKIVKTTKLRQLESTWVHGLPTGFHAKPFRLVG